MKQKIYVGEIYKKVLNNRLFQKSIYYNKPKIHQNQIKAKTKKIKKIKRIQTQQNIVQQQIVNK